MVISSLDRQQFGGAVYAFAYPQISAAAADISRHGRVDFAIGGVLASLEQGRGRHQLSGLAITALRHTHFNPRLLHRVQLARPSMVVIFLPTACEAGVTHDLVACPSICTVHAPHCEMPQPNLVPVRPMLSRITHNKGVSGSTSTECDLPLILREIAIGPPPQDSE
jgi:hypothetical protein